MVDRGEVLDLIEKEIVSAQERGTPSGYSSWVLISAAAAIAWSASQTIQSHIIDLVQAVIVLYLFFVAYEFFTYLKGLLFPPFFNQETKTRFSPPGDTTLRLGGIFIVVWYAVPLILISVLPIPLPQYLIILNYVAFLSLCIIGLLGVLTEMILSLFEIPLRNMRTAPGVGNTIFIAECTILVILFVNFFQILLQSKIDFVSAQLGGLLFAIIFILLQLARMTDISVRPFIEAMNNTRRNLVFGKIDEKYAAEQVEILILGRSLDHVMQSQVNSAADLFGRMNAKLDSLETDLEKLQEENLGEETRGSIIEHANIVSAESEELSAQTNKLIDKIMGRIAVVRLFHREGVDAGMDGLRTKMNVFIGETTERIARLKKKLQVPPKKLS